ncbi:hypothetical protein [Trichococcus shcherbakoviae]|uniref:hypothetical protein n=1 Tax=Trichococcus shcherbakoviae TaxID=2094020 RepID=UPI002AA709E8|nr:hypothetical protein [Trichococcus shcherbakoviae]
MMTLKGTSSLHRTTYFHLCFHDNTLIFRKQLISLGSGIIEFAGVMGAEKMDNYPESIVLAPNPGEKMNNSPESMFWETIEKKQGPPRN